MWDWIKFWDTSFGLAQFPAVAGIWRVNHLLVNLFLPLSFCLWNKFKICICIFSFANSWFQDTENKSNKNETKTPSFHCESSSIILLENNYYFPSAHYLGEHTRTFAITMTILQASFVEQGLCRSYRLKNWTWKWMRNALNCFWVFWVFFGPLPFQQSQNIHHQETIPSNAQILRFWKNKVTHIFQVWYTVRINGHGRFSKQNN